MRLYLVDFDLCKFGIFTPLLRCRLYFFQSHHGLSANSASKDTKQLHLSGQAKFLFQSTIGEFKEFLLAIVSRLYLVYGYSPTAYRPPWRPPSSLLVRFVLLHSPLPSLCGLGMFLQGVNGSELILL